MSPTPHDNTVSGAEALARPSGQALAVPAKPEDGLGASRFDPSRVSGAKHTPGPWDATYVGCERATLIGTADRETAFARMVQYDGTPDAETQAANARLIAAAPELLAAGSDAVEPLCGWANEGGIGRDEWNRRSAIVAALTSAIAKAVQS